MVQAMVLQMPEQRQLTAFFESEPVQAEPWDGYWCYQVRDSRGVSLRFSFDIFERSIQTVVFLADDVLVEVSHEGATRLDVVEEGEGTFLVGECEHEADRSKLVIRLKPEIFVKWSALTVMT